MGGSFAYTAVLQSGICDAMNVMAPMIDMLSGNTLLDTYCMNEAYLAYSYVHCVSAIARRISARVFARSALFAVRVADRGIGE